MGQFHCISTTKSSTKWPIRELNNLQSFIVNSQEPWIIKTKKETEKKRKGVHEQSGSKKNCQILTMQIMCSSHTGILLVVRRNPNYQAVISP